MHTALIALLFTQYSRYVFRPSIYQVSNSQGHAVGTECTIDIQIAVLTAVLLYEIKCVREGKENNHKQQNFILSHLDNKSGDFNFEISFNIYIAICIHSWRKTFKLFSIAR